MKAQRLVQTRLLKLSLACFAVTLGLWFAWSQIAPHRQKGFQLSNAIIPADEIHAGGPPKDGIPSIDKPKFLPPESVDYLGEEDLVISVRVGGTVRAYPLRILVWHEIVNDEIAGRPIAVTYCPLCGTAMVFERKFGDQTVTFGVSGLLYQSDVLMYDRQTESLWSQLAMKAVSGRMVKTPLKLIASEHMTWSEWRRLHPQGEVLSKDTGFVRTYDQMPYGGYEQSDSTMFPVPSTRKELSRKTWVLGIIIGNQAKAYQLEQLPEKLQVKDKLGSEVVLITYDPKSRYPKVTDATGKPVPYILAYWFAWQAFYPKTELWKQ